MMMAIGTEARKIHDEAIIIDGCSFFSKGWHERLQKAGTTALQMTVPWPWDDARQGLRRYEEYLQLTRNDPKLEIITSVDVIRAAKAEGKVGFILGAQNASILENDPGLAEIFQRIGVRVIQLSYSQRNLLADGCFESSNAGLSLLGEVMIKELNRVGIQIDLSHVGERSSLEAMEISSRPCIFSHSNPAARTSHVRNITDEQIRKCAESGGVVGLSPHAPINWTGGEIAPSLDDFVGHLEYVVDLVGIDHVSFGTDSEATPGAYPPEVRTSLRAAYPPSVYAFSEAHPGVTDSTGFETMEDLPNVTAALLDRGWTETDLRKFLGENLMRVYGENWYAA